jgi:hypothetical protein
MIHSARTRFATAARSEAGLARPHGVALPGNRKWRRPDAPDISGDQCERVDRVHGFGSLCRVIHAHRPADEPGLRASVEQSRFVDLLLAQPGELRDVLGRELR